MAHQIYVKDFNDLQIQWVWNKKKQKAVLNSTNPKTGEVKSYSITKKIAEILVKHGMSSGS